MCLPERHEPERNGTEHVDYEVLRLGLRMQPHITAT